jgi:hypothetical protein
LNGACSGTTNPRPAYILSECPLWNLQKGLGENVGYALRNNSIRGSRFNRLTQRIHSVEYKRGSQGGEDNMMDIDIVYEVVKHQGYIYVVHEYTKHQCDINVVHEVAISIKLKCGRHGCDRMIVGLTTDMPYVTTRSEAVDLTRKGKYAFMTDISQLEFVQLQDCETLVLCILDSRRGYIQWNINVVHREGRIT